MYRPIYTQMFVQIGTQISVFKIKSVQEREREKERERERERENRDRKREIEKRA